MTDPTTTTAAAPAATPNVFAQIEATLSADWKSAAAFFQVAEQSIGTFLVNVANGAAVVIADIESVGQYVAAHLGVITAGISSLSAVAGAVAPNNVSVQKVIADLNTGAQDVAALSTALASGSNAGDPAIVTKAVTAINATKQLAQLVSNAGSMMTTLAGNSPTATQAVT